MKVVCISNILNGEVIDIEIDRVYEVHKSFFGNSKGYRYPNIRWYTIKYCDNWRDYPSNIFINLDDWRDKKITELGI